MSFCSPEDQSGLSGENKHLPLSASGGCEGEVTSKIPEVMTLTASEGLHVVHMDQGKQSWCGSWTEIRVVVNAGGSIGVGWAVAGGWVERRVREGGQSRD